MHKIQPLARLAMLVGLLVVLMGALAPRPALARPCCSDCPSWPNLDPYNDPCARVCDFGC